MLAVVGNSRVLTHVAEIQAIAFHLNCDVTETSHISFANDLMVFCRANEWLIKCMKEIP